MDIDTVYPVVTEAIRQAEALEDRGAPEARGAFSEVSRLEEQIAEIVSLNDYEGVVARRGAVRAAIKAREFSRAQNLAARYAAEDGVDDELAADLEALQREALAQTLVPMLLELTISIQELSLTQSSRVIELIREVAALQAAVGGSYAGVGSAPMAALKARVSDLVVTTRELTSDLHRRFCELNREVADLQLGLVSARLAADEPAGKLEGQPLGQSVQRQNP